MIYLLDISNRRYEPLTIEKLENSLPVAQVEVQCHEMAHRVKPIDVWNAIKEVLAHKTRIPAQSVDLACIINNDTNGKGAKPGRSAFLQRMFIVSQISHSLSNQSH